MDEKESPNNEGLRQPRILPAMKWAEVRDRAQRIFTLRGEPPYGVLHYPQPNQQTCASAVSEDEAAVISDFVTYWRDYLMIKEKP